MEFRALLIEIFNQLSDNDRQSLHFVVGNRVPRNARDDCTPSGSLRLLDFLFDQTLITEQNYDYLIHVFERIKCYEAAKRLRQHKLSTTSTSIVEAVLSESLLNIADDKMKSSFGDHSERFSHIYEEEQPSTELENSILQPNNNIFFAERYQFDDRERKQLSSTITKVLTKKYLILSIILTLILILCILLYLMLVRFCFIESPKLNDTTLSGNINQKIVYVIREGLKYGDSSLFQNETFGDAKNLELSYGDRCIGVELKWSSNALSSILFLYNNNRSLHARTSQREELSIFQSEFTNVFLLDSNEEISKINLYQDLHETHSSIIGIRFYTTNGRKTNVFGSNDGHFLTESFEHYTFRYANGRQNRERGIEMLQFFWIKQCSMNDQIGTVPRTMVEKCAFTYTSNKDFKFVNATGIETSWYDIKRKLNLQGDQCDPTASYYEKISKRGPEVFAIVNRTSVFYHEHGEWHKYGTAADVICAIIP
ncbi:unnamed protein product [Rotaria magnacalcarata]|uniref:DED domain-containing protein n=1 Tax=Rotaria magnacalcarata TaxID=392030 RepID=A0A815TVF2_9BILA|nr:unnamed protein product [Rotaria magnacalcarata]